MALIGTAPATEHDVIVNAAISEVGEIATLPEITVKIIQIVENPRSTARDLHDVIKNDPALSARILKVVNSAFYGLPGQIASVDRAIVLLGLSAVKNIAIAASMTRLFNGGAQIEGFNGLEVWKHSVAVAVACKLLAAAQGKPSMEEVFLAGLIHDLGLLVERQVHARKIVEVISRHKAEPRPFCDIENEIIGADHQAFGMGLATKWRFPRPLCLAIGYHHKPMTLAPEHQPLPSLVHIADVIACKSQIGFCQTALIEEIDPQVLAVVSLNAGDIDNVSAALPEQVATAEAIFQS